MTINVNAISPRQKLIIEKGLLDYQFIMDNWQSDGGEFEEFKMVYYDFYLKARWAVMSKAQNSEPYFNKMQNLKDKDQVDLMTVLEELKEETKSESYEFSLVSKMLHTIKPNTTPIYDSKVREYLSQNEGVNLWWQIPNRESGAKRGTPERTKIEHDWKELCNWYDTFIQSPRGKEWIDWFNDNFPEYRRISDIKKVDFIIFATN